MPAMTSSQMSRMPYLSQSARTPLSQPFGGTRTPFVPVTVSRMIAAIVCAPSMTMVSSRYFRWFAVTSSSVVPKR